MASTQSPYSNLKSPPVMRSLSQAQGSSSSPYLPGYLFGGSPAPATQPGSNNNPSNYGHKMQHTPSHLNSRSSMSSLGDNRSFHAASSPYARENRLLDSDKILRKEKPGAPPTESLYSAKRPTTSSSSSGDEMNQYRNSSQSHQSPHPFGGGAGFNGRNLPPTSPQEETFMTRCNPGSQTDADSLRSPAQIDPFYTQGDDISSDDIMDETAITVFGFPPSACSFIIQQFSQYGKIEKYEVHNRGNWVHVKYQTKLQAKKALSKNGKIFARTMMIGVCGCIKKDISNLEATYNNTMSANADLNKTPTIVGMKRQSSTSIRSLSTASNAKGVVGPMSPLVDKNTPQKKDSVVSRTLDYVFGW